MKSGSVLFTDEMQKIIEPINEEMEKIIRMVKSARSKEYKNEIGKRCDAAQSSLVDLILILNKREDTTKEIAYIESKIRNLENLKTAIKQW
jgi:mevalonate kinase